uniref:Uncharacterized protein n=1 Tax=Athene cunicularia TaxID=194338 RepID=A0A663MR17_ATHCN
FLADQNCRWSFFFNVAFANIAMASKGDQTFCSVLHPGKYCCISQSGLDFDGLCDLTKVT